MGGSGKRLLVIASCGMLIGLVNGMLDIGFSWAVTGNLMAGFVVGRIASLIK
ncbi:MAG: hypothetical protein Q7S52_01425 [bacterium]|nr:hypothetical protein [bacterium]